MPSINVSEETLKLIKDQLSGAVAPAAMESLDEMVGQKWFFRTVTYHLVGRVTKRLGNFLLLEDAAWVADSGRFTNTVKNGTYSEAEIIGTALVNLDTVTDAFPWAHSLPLVQK